MEYNFFRNKKFSKLCFGCEALGGTDWGKTDLKEISNAIDKSLDLGINFFDTADCYSLGLSEKRLSSILGARRHDLLIATKGGVSWTKFKNQKRAKIETNCSKDYLKKAIDNSLRRLKLDVLPIYYIHKPDPNIEIEETFSFLNEMQILGKIGLIGCSNFSYEQVKRAHTFCDLSLVQLPYNILNRPLQKKLIDFCKKSNVKIVAYNVLYSGFLTGKFDLNSKFGNDDRRSRISDFKGKKLYNLLKKVKQKEKLANKNKFNLLEYSIKTVLAQNEIMSVITGIKSVKQAEENIKTLS